MSFINDFNGTTSLNNIRDYTEVNSDYTTTENDYIVNVVSKSDIILLDSTQNQGIEQVIKNSTNQNIKVSGTLNQTIDGKLFWIVLPNNAIRVQSNGIDWIII